MLVYQSFKFRPTNWSKSKILLLAGTFRALLKVKMIKYFIKMWIRLLSFITFHGRIEPILTLIFKNLWRKKIYIWKVALGYKVQFKQKSKESINKLAKSSGSHHHQLSKKVLFDIMKKVYGTLQLLFIT